MVTGDALERATQVKKARETGSYPDMRVNSIIPETEDCYSKQMYSESNNNIVVCSLSGRNVKVSYSRLPMIRERLVIKH
jgi:hypothetical protein